MKKINVLTMAFGLMSTGAFAQSSSDFLYLNPTTSQDNTLSDTFVLSEAQASDPEYIASLEGKNIDLHFVYAVEVDNETGGVSVVGPVPEMPGVRDIRSYPDYWDKVGGALIGAGIGALQEISYQGTAGKRLDWRSVGWSALQGAAGGAISPWKTALAVSSAWKAGVVIGIARGSSESDK